MARLSLVTGFTPGEKNAVTSLGHPSVMAYNPQDSKFTKNAFSCLVPEVLYPEELVKMCYLLCLGQGISNERETRASSALSLFMVASISVSLPAPLPLSLLPAACTWGTEAFNVDVKD